MKKIYLTFEFFVLFVLLPVLITIFRSSMKRMVVPLLILVCVLILLFLLFDKTFELKRLWSVKNFSISLKYVLVKFIFGGIVLTILVYCFDKQLLLLFPRRNLKFWLIIMVFYPLLSAYPQEMLYRLFFFHRYRIIFKQNLQIILISGICFGLAHLFFLNFWAIILSSLGGLLFAYTYTKTNSIIITSIEHGLWGDLIFTIGLGVYFFSGAIR